MSEETLRGMVKMALLGGSREQEDTTVLCEDRFARTDMLPFA